MLSFSCFGQNPQEKITLERVLTMLEDRHNYTFNYLQSSIENMTVAPPSMMLSIEEAIDSLRSQTGLIFTFLENRFVSIKQKNELVLCGYLKNINTQAAVANATIQGGGAFTLSKDDGFFELRLNGLDENITIRFLGHKTIERNPKYFNLSDCATIYMVPEYQALSSVILSNYLVEGIDKLSTGSYQIDFSKFDVLPGLTESDVLQAVQSLPGIQSINETVSNINIRGGTHDQNLILWDDIKMYQSGHFFGLISAFNPQITQKVTLQKNATAVDYSDGVSGTISMLTDDKITKKLSGNIGVNLIDANAMIDLPIGSKSSLQMAARKSINDIATSPTYKQYFKRISQDTEIENNEEFIANSDQEFDFYDVALRYLYQISDKDRIRLNFIYINNDLVFNENTTTNNEQRSRESSISQNSLGAGLHYERIWSDRFHSTLHIYETDYKLKAVNANLLAAQRFLQENVVSETGIKLKSRYTINKHLSWKIGYQFLETEVTNLDDVDVPITRTLISEVVRTHSGFSQLDVATTNERTHINVGFRYNYLDKFRTHLFEPRLNVNHTFGSNFSAEFLGEFKHQITSQVINFQNDFLGVEKRRWQLSNNEDIPIIKSKQASLVLNYNPKNWLLTGEVYYKNVTGITTQSQGFQNQYEFVKTSGSYTALGLDMLIRKRFEKASIWLSYSFMDNTYEFSELPEVTFPSNLDITHALTLGSTYQYKALKLGAGLNWHSGNPTTRPLLENETIDGTINFGAANSSRQKDYLRLDASLAYDFKINKVAATAGLSLWNILDQKNVVSSYYRINESSGMAEEFVQNALGFTPHATLRAYF